MAEAEPIAIVGISVQIPGGGTSDDLDYSTLWEFLLKGGKSDEIDTDGSFSWMMCGMANRASYALDLTGPSVYLDTACSSSLTGFHLAVNAIEKGDCSAAIVGAAQTNRDMREWKAYAQGGVLSPDGMCKPMDDTADGFGRGEGAVVVVLKRLDLAIQDNDHIYCVVAGSSINATGSQMPLNVPNGVAQQRCIIEAYKRAGLSFDMADYVELHATGTSVGDPIEANMSGSLFAHDTAANFGSIKGNIGHLEVTAFLASVAKACLMFEHGIIPPTVNFSKPSGGIRWNDFKGTVPVEPVPLGNRSGRPIISLTSAGLGGSTGHVVLRALASRPDATLGLQASLSIPVLFIVGGLSPNAVTHLVQIASQLPPSDLRKFAVTLARRARQVPWRTFFILSSPRESLPPPPSLVPRQPSPLVFVFSGQGPQHYAMGRQLFAESPVFRATILELDAVYRRVEGVSLVESTGLFDSPSYNPTVTLSETSWPVMITLSSLAMIQMAMFDLLTSLGVVPDMMLGHSAGETIALYASGAGPKEMAMEIAIARGKAMSFLEDQDLGMAALACNSEHAMELVSQVLEDGKSVLEISCFNAPQSVVLSGAVSQLDKVVALAKSQNMFAQRLRTKIPNHSSFMDLIKDDYTTRMADIFSCYPGPHIPRIPVFSTCRRCELVDEFTSEYFWENCRNEVLFTDAVTKLLDSHLVPIFVEICCHPVLASSLSAHGIPEARSLCPMRRSSPTKPAPSSGETTLFLETLGRLSLLGVNSLDLTTLYGRGASPIESKPVEHPLIRRQISPPKLRGPPRLQGVLRKGPLASARLSMNKKTHPDLAEHVINGESILPATGFIEILLESGANFLWDVEFLSILSLASDSPLDIEVQRANSAWSIRTGSGSLGREHARGCMDDSEPSRPPSKIDLGPIWQRLPVLNLKGFYSSLQPMASYGTRFQRVVRCHGGPAEVIAEISGASNEELAQGYVLHPVLMDSCLHALLHPDVTRQNSKNIIYLPSRLGHLTFYRRTPAPGNWFAHMNLRQWTPDTLVYDMTVTDSSGVALCELRSFALKKFSSLEPLSIKRRFDLVFQPVIATVDVPRLEVAFPEREDQSQVIILNKLLDAMAVDMIRKSLSQELVVGDAPSRHRYLEFAKRVSTRATTVDVDPQVVQVLRERWPNHFEITQRVAAIHPSVFESPTRAVNVLYSDDLMAKFYSKDSQTSDVCIEATKAFADVLSALSKAGKRVVKILEVGAGTGLLTHHLVGELRQNKDIMSEYTVTDISYALVSDLARHIDFTPIIPKAYDISKDPQTQGIFLEAYDIVVSLHVLHAAPDLHASLESLTTLLVPGGSLLTVELDGTSWGANPGSVWMDCIFGCFSEWFGYADGRKHCTLSPAAWMDQLEASGFVNVQTCTENNGGRDFYFLAQKPAARLPNPEVSIDSADIYLYEFGKEIELQTWLRAYDREVPTTLYLAAVQGRDADAAVGLCVILRKELPLWNIRLCIFELGADIVPVLTKNKWVFESGEDTVFFDRDGAHVTRLALGRSPPTSSQQTALTVRVSHWAGISSSYDGFVGHVESPSHPNFPRDTLVGGVAVKVAADDVTISVDNAGLVLVPVLAVTVDLAKDMLGTVVTSFIAEGVRRKRTLVALQNAELTCDVQKRVAGMTGSRLVLADHRDVDSFQCVDILLCDWETYSKNPHLRRWIARDGKLIIWDTLLKQSRQQDPSYVQQAIAKLGYGQINHVPMLPTPPSNPLRRASPPFRGDGMYVLLGGIGGLGVDLAVWMYQHGARHLVLTSRRGIASLDPVDDAITLAKIGYLSGLEDLQLQLEACDGTRADQMGDLVGRLSKSAPIAGCFLMALVLSDASFFDQTRATLDAVYDSKVKMLEVFASEVDIASLDFFVALSSISGLIGIAGQANYASACTTVDGILAGYKNAFSLITPGISDVGFLDRASSKHITRKDRFGSITAQTLWAYLEDGLRKLDDAPFNQYIPDLDWDSLETHLTLPGTCRHLISPIQRRGSDFVVAGGGGIGQEQAGTDLLHHVLELLEVPAEEFDADQPLSVYGLDSITAAKVAAELRPYAAVSQMQLLGGATWSDVLAIMKAAAEANPSMNAILFETLGVPAEEFSADLPLASYGLDSLGASRLATALQPFIVVTQMQLMGQSSWNEILRSGDRPVQPTSSSGSAAECIVEICGGEGTPLIILPGANGSAALFFGLRDTFQGPLWAIQVTESTPLESMTTLVAYWKTQICAKRPHGPYRFAAYSAAVIPSVTLVKLFEDAGEEVLQLTFIDNSPTVWIHEACEALLRKQSAADFRTLSDEMVLDMLKNDPSTSPDALATYEAAIEDRTYTPFGARTELTISRVILTLTFEFLEGFYPASDDRSYAAFIGPFEEWLFSLRAPLAVILAEFGMLLSTPCRGWPDLGASRFPGPRPVKEHLVPGVGHYSLFRQETVARLLGEY
ncbi:Polyketide synthase [Mycena venus]|uniref:Polyketide synthase n=1 Tax=Mycena venus TaxID=2733690 RepID=A0A8H6YEC1_9AGAR|nr:Polyketide synthase [Mycena venus]